MHVSQLRFYQFRNLVDQSVDLESGLVYITGNNGNGKTNFVESLYLLTGSRSFRTNSLTELVKWGCSSGSVFGKVQKRENETEVGLVFHPGRREGYLDGRAIPTFSDLLGRISAVAFSPADLSLVKGTPQGRRKFLDRHMVDRDPRYLNTLMSYQRALDSKNAVLKENSGDTAKVTPWNSLLAEYGSTIVRERIRFLEDLQLKSGAYHSQYGASDGALTLTLESDFNKDGCSERESIQAQLHSLLGREIAQRVSVSGAHRDDVAIQIGGIDARAYASQGQARSVVLSMKLGVIDMVEESLQEAPIVLLDDVDSELDPHRSHLLFDAVTSKSRQILVTGAGAPPPGIAGRGNLQILTVVQGRITSVARE